MDTMGVGFALLGTSNVKFISDNEADNIFNYIKAAGIIVLIQPHCMEVDYLRRGLVSY